METRWTKYVPLWKTLRFRVENSRKRITLIDRLGQNIRNRNCLIVSFMIIQIHCAQNVITGMFKSQTKREAVEYTQIVYPHYCTTLHQQGHRHASENSVLLHVRSVCSTPFLNYQKSNTQAPVVARGRAAYQPEMQLRRTWRTRRRGRRWEVQGHRRGNCDKDCIKDFVLLNYHDSRHSSAPTLIVDITGWGREAWQGISDTVTRTTFFVTLDFHLVKSRWSNIWPHLTHSYRRTLGHRAGMIQR